MATEKLWAWELFDESTAAWNILGAIVDGMVMPLVTSREHLVDAMRSLAHAHADATKTPVRLAVYELTEVKETR